MQNTLTLHILSMSELEVRSMLQRTTSEPNLVATTVSLGSAHL